MPFFGNHMPYPTLGILNIPLVAGNDMNMHVENTLPGWLSYVDTDIVAIRIKFCIEKLLFLFNKVHAGSHFFRRQIEKAGHMPTWNDHGMPRTRRIGVTSTVSKVITQGHPFCVCTKQAGIIGVSFFGLCCFRRQQNTSSNLIYFNN